MLFEILKRLKYMSGCKLFLLAIILIIIFFFMIYLTDAQFYLFQMMGGVSLKMWYFYSEKLKEEKG